MTVFAPREKDPGSYFGAYILEREGDHGMIERIPVPGPIPGLNARIFGSV